MMKVRLLVWLAAALLAVSALGAVQRTGRGSGSAARAHALTSRGNTNDVRVTSAYSKFRHKAWVTGNGRVKRIMGDDMDPPCHQRFILEDAFGQTILIAHNIDVCSRLSDLGVGDIVAFKGEYVSTARGGLVHWTHPDESHRRPGGWLKKLATAASADEETAAWPDTREAEASLPAEFARKEYFAGSGPMETRTPAPVCEDWPETGYWLSTNSDARHNRRCENYRKTRGYPCKKSEGRPCGKCGG